MIRTNEITEKSVESLTFEERQELVANLLDELGIEYKIDFVPFSQSRNAKDKPSLNDLSLNWKVSFGDRFTTDYMQGVGYCNSYYQGMRPTIHNVNLVLDECENGNTKSNKFWYLTEKEKSLIKIGDTPKPHIACIMYSLVMDSDVIDSDSFEDWADCLGYDRDSRKAEKIYNQCKEIAFNMLKVFGRETISKFRLIFQDY